MGVLGLSLGGNELGFEGERDLGLADEKEGQRVFPISC